MFGFEKIYFPGNSIDNVQCSSMYQHVTSVKQKVQKCQEVYGIRNI